ncbi:uncharacterized protein LOC129785859 [Lutzomyia longipalpis]|uniref:uncharacterized protein LOC129785859 n=1 Tax=Lutzomyia longipalpis TaxID=7200 RepID=UPI0024840A7D|nr:uncharacterized protein LOC129785859 [Lutzomyia longipalpis]
MMERLIVVFITAAAMCGTKASQSYHSFAEPRADPPNVKGHYSYSDPHGAIFHVTYETDKKSSAKSTSDRDFTDFGGPFSAKRNPQNTNFNRPIYIVNTDNDEEKYNDKLNYQTSSTTKSPFKYGGFHFSTTPSPHYNSLPTSQKPSVISHTNNNANQGSFRPVMTKFTVNHPNPPPKQNQGNLISSRYQQYYEDEEEYVDTKRDTVNVAPVSDKYLNDYQQALSKLQAASSNIARRPANTPKSQIKKYNGIPPNAPNNYLIPKNKPSQKPIADPDPKNFKPKFKLQHVPNLYPKDEPSFKPSMEFPPDKVSSSKQKEYFEPPPKYVYTNDNVQYYNVDGGAVPPSKSQNPQQYLKRQNQLKLQQQMIMEKIKKSRAPYSYGQASQTNFRPIVPQQPPHRFSAPRRKPSRAFTPAAARTPYKSRPIIDGPYSIRISM